METFNPSEKEAKLRQESESWDTSRPIPADAGDIPTVDVEQYFRTSSTEALEQVAAQLRRACTDVGFYYLVGHDFDVELKERMFQAVEQFHDLPQDTKAALAMDRPDWPVSGVGYLPVRHFKLPKRAKGNVNEAFIIKRELGPRNVTLEANQWPQESTLPGFKSTVLEYAAQIEALALKLLPIYARALGVEKDFFDEGFSSPIYRLRMTRYPPIAEYQTEEFGIAPHVDTTFFTILAQDAAGLSIFSEARNRWLVAPAMPNAFVVNTGELLKHWTNDHFLSVKHFANNNVGETARHSIPFFFNASASYVMRCVPTCCSSDDPPKHPPISYLQSQSVVQGE